MINFHVLACKRWYLQLSKMGQESTFFIPSLHLILDTDQYPLSNLNWRQIFPWQYIHLFYIHSRNVYKYKFVYFDSYGGFQRALGENRGKGKEWIMLKRFYRSGLETIFARDKGIIMNWKIYKKKYISLNIVYYQKIQIFKKIDISNLYLNYLLSLYPW